MKKSLTIRSAAPNEADCLSELAVRSKAYWGYSHEFMEARRSELSVSADKVLGDEYKFAVAEEDGKIVGFYTLEAVSNSEYELEALFVEPDRIGSRESDSVPGRLLPLFEIGVSPAGADDGMTKPCKD